MRVVEPKTPDQIIAEWDALADVRARQISSGQDITFLDVLVPSILNAVSTRQPNVIADVGCGVGFLARELARSTEASVVGIDPGPNNIDACMQHSRDEDGITFRCQTAEQFAASSPGVDIVVANMVLSSVVRLRQFLESVRMSLVDHGLFVFTIPHPCFWPLHRGYFDLEKFDYSSEVFVEDGFSIALDSHAKGTATHIHRSLEMYFRGLAEAGLTVVGLRELAPAPEVENRYPVPWRYPRFATVLASRNP